MHEMDRRAVAGQGQAKRDLIPTHTPRVAVAHNEMTPIAIFHIYSTSSASVAELQKVVSVVL